MHMISGWSEEARLVFSQCERHIEKSSQPKLTMWVLDAPSCDDVLLLDKGLS